MDESGEELLVGRLLLGDAGGHRLPDLGELLDDGGVAGGEPVGLGQVHDGGVLVLEAGVGEAPAVQRLDAVRVLDAADGEGRVGQPRRVVPVAQFDGHEGAVAVEGEADGVHLGLEGQPAVGLAVQVRLLVQVPEALLVLVQGGGHVPGLEGPVAKLLALGGDGGHTGGGEVRALVLGEVLIGVAQGVTGGARGGVVAVASQELAAVGDGGGLLGPVTRLGAEVLDLPDYGLALDYLAKHHVLVVEVRGRDGGDEELGAVCA